MGGYGSTRWTWHTKKDTVDDSRALSIFDFKREGMLDEPQQRWGRWLWTNRRTGEERASVRYELNTVSSRPYLRLQYTTRRWQREPEAMDYIVKLQATFPHFDGRRWWFTCPLTVNGRYCGRRVGKLYLPPAGRYFGCRHCYDLTYRSCQESDKRLLELRRLGPDAILEGMKRGHIDLLQGLKALPDWLWRG